jgi:lysophospholipase L1-like esterase
MRRVAARAAAAAAGLVALQAAALAATYETPLDACGPHHGVCSPLLSPAAAASAALPFRAARATEEYARRPQRTFWWQQRPQRAHAHDGAAHEARHARGAGGTAVDELVPTRLVRCIVLGDSLVSGVGSSVAGSPALPQRFAAALAERLGAQVTWRALGQTGAGVAEMRHALLPLLRRDAEAHAGQPPPTVLLLLCGLNDFKRLHHGTTASSFHEALAAFVEELRELCGSHTLIVLPALPLAATARFPVPLHWLVCALGARFDEQKRKLAETLSRHTHTPRGGGRVLFVDVPTLPTAREVPQLLSCDGVHPNDLGYARWGAHIADAVALHLLHARGAASLSPPP